MHCRSPTAAVFAALTCTTILLSSLQIQPALSISDRGSSLPSPKRKASTSTIKPSITASHVPFSKPQTLSASNPRHVRDDSCDTPPEWMMTIRGGEEQQHPQSSSNNPYEQPAVYNPNQNNNNNNYEDGFANYKPPLSAGANVNDDDFDTTDVFHESVQDRVDKWRNEQMQKYGHLTPEQEANPRDETGRAKLVQHVSKGARATIFFLLMWRDMTLFDIADHSIKGGFGRRMVRTIVTIMFVGNLAGAVASFTSPSHSAKRRLKMILNGDKLIEIVLLLWYFLRLTILPSELVPREVIFAGAFHSLFFLLQAQAFTRLTWDENVAPPPPPAQSRRHQQQQSSTVQYDELSAPQRTWDDDEPNTLYVSNPTYQGNYNDNRSY